MSDVSSADLQIMASELVANSVRHAGIDTADDIVVTAVRIGDVVRVEVSDTGPGFDPDVVSDSRDEGSWGIFLVKRLSSDWGVHTDPACTTVWFEVTARA